MAPDLSRPLINAPARVAHSVIDIILHLTAHWPRAPRWQRLFHATSQGPIVNGRLGIQVGGRMVSGAVDMGAHQPLLPADVLVLGQILHGGDINEKKLLLQKAYDVLPEGGALIAYNAIIDDERRTNTFGLLMSLHMLLNSPAGSEYTGTQCRTWMQEAGFRTSYLEHLTGGDSMVVGIK